MTLQMWTAVLKAAQNQWQEQSDTLSAPFRNLAQADPALLGTRVGPAATTFISTWTEQVAVQRRKAGAHSEALAETIADFTRSEDANVERIRGLLMWSDRETQPLAWGTRP